MATKLDFSIQDSDEHTFTPLVGADVADCLDLSKEHYGDEMSGQLTLDIHRAAHQLTDIVVQQLYYPTKVLAVACREKAGGRLIGYIVARRDCYQEFSSDETTELRIIHIAKDITSRQKVRLVGQFVLIWNQWAVGNKIPVMVSATLREEQSAFLRILETLGFTVSGSYAWFRTDRVTPELIVASS